MSNIAFLFLPLAFSSLPAVLPFVSPSSQVYLAMKGLIETPGLPKQTGAKDLQDSIFFERAVPKPFLFAGGGAAGKQGNPCRDTQVLSCEGPPFRDLEFQ